ncbi:MAG TPA: sporulation protein YabP [Firmicutes bacterium]|jgi:sporulation protein YabP|nr:sporulation protein YabP [Bacillota bacterium]
MLLLCGEVRDVEERRLNSVRHQLILAEREKLTLDGVLHVESFDDGEIVLETELGGLVVQGEDLHIKELNLEKGNLLVQGYIQSVEYLGDSLGKKSRGFLARLFR